MSIRRHSFIWIFAILFCVAGTAMAGDQAQDRTKDQDRLMDGSCLDDAIDVAGWKVVAADRDRDRDRTRDQDCLMDGSCLDDAIDAAGWRVVAADRDRTRDRDRLKDGSCKG